jgi:hypothetical protein
MGLFSTLLSTNTGRVNDVDADADAGVDAATTNAAPSSLSVPTVIQMYTDKPFELELPTTRATRTQIPPYAHLTYQAVPVNPTADATVAAPEPTAGLRKISTVSHVPDLGVWNCRVTAERSGTDSSTTPLADALLAIPTKAAKTTAKHTFCWKVDLSDPERVEPTLASLQAALVRYLIQSNDYSSTQTEAVSSPAATTTLYQLRSVQFGLAADEKTKDDKVTTAPDERDRKVKVALQISAAWPKTVTQSDEGDSYRRQQTLALLYYHLRRYAAALNASLVFVRANTTSPVLEEGEDAASVADPSATTLDMLQPTLTIPQLGAIWRALAQGKAVWTPQVWSDVLEISSKPTLDPANDDEAAAAAEDNATAALVYGPDNHTEEWIESVLLRNAQYPGHWDAAKDSIWKILPPPADESITSAATAPAVGDEVWLQELRNSVAVPSEPAPMSTPTRPTATGTEAKTPDVSDFFANMLK